jgi:hypothetical protein
MHGKDMTGEFLKFMKESEKEVSAVTTTGTLPGGKQVMMQLYVEDGQLYLSINTPIPCPHCGKDIRGDV